LRNDWSYRISGPLSTLLLTLQGTLLSSLREESQKEEREVQSLVKKTMRLLYHSQRPALEELQRQFPKATPSECRRFFKVCPRDAMEKMTAYLEWREKHQLDSLEEITDESGSDDSLHPAALSPQKQDRKDWEEAVREAIFARQTIGVMDGSHLHGTPDTSCDDTFNETESLEEEEKRGFYRFKGHRHTGCGASDKRKLKSVSQCIYTVRSETDIQAHDLEGHRIMMHFPGKIDLHFSSSNEFYAEAMALFIDRLLDRNDEEKMTLVVDCRPGKNWPNPSALSLLGFIRHVAHALHDLNPNRLRHSIFYPVPRAAMYIWKMISTFLDPTLRDLVVLVPGPRAMLKYMDEQTLVSIEKLRERAQNEW
jgi:hypothetical protein